MHVARSVAAITLVGCSGGQSGTDSSEYVSCQYDDGETIELEQPWLGLTAAEHVALLNTEWSVQYVPFVDNTESNMIGPDELQEAIPLALSVDVDEAVLRHPLETEECEQSQDILSLDASVHVTLGDTFEFVADGPLLTLTADGAFLHQQFCWDSETHTASLAEASCDGGAAAGSITLELRYRPSEPSGYVLDRFRIYWDSATTDDYERAVVNQTPLPEPPPAHRPLPEVEQLCALEESVDAGSFDTEADAKAAVTGTWALCDAERSWPFAGVEISSEGTWNAIVAEEGSLRVSQGFEQEGTLRFWDTSEQNERPGFFQVDLIGPHWWFPAGAIFLSASGNTLDLSESRLVRIDPAIDPAIDTEPAPDANAGDRLGEAACTSAETGMQDYAKSADDVRRNLAGEYVGCEGVSGSLKFDAAGKVTLPAPDGAEPQTLSYTVVQTKDNTAQLTVGNETWWPALSSTPAKLWIYRESNSNFEQLETWVLSALPD